ncbi:hypothetical protein AURDEDRAFT_161503 [Auricularia subglabra TFB-10046 SS5]|nr:hypothetical protein AURDEDRAFT_161503 [Auricularia subglabra TFB-10046 SS5]
MPVHFPDVLLSSVLDFMDLETHLLSAMPVSTYWRAQTIDHRTYWRSIALREPGPRGIERQRHELSTDLFLLRLSRTHARPIELSVYWDNPHVVLAAIAPHLSHIRRLSFYTNSEHWDAVFSVLRATAAPLMESLTLACVFGQSASVALPRDIFSEHAPALREVALSNIQLTSADALPPFFDNIALLRFEGTARQFSLPNLFPHCPRLKQLDLFGNITPGDPALLLPETWSALGSLGLFGRMTALRWTNLGSALSQTSLIFLYDAALQLASLDSLGFWVEFSPRGETAARRRVVHMALPKWVIEFPQLHAITAFQDDSLADRIMELVIALEHWAVLVGRYLTRFPALERLVITMTLPDVQWPQSPKANMFCQRLEKLAFRRPGHALNILLSSMLDFLDVEALLLCAMPVSRYWREQVIEHRTYWRSIALMGTGPNGIERRKHELSKDLFLLRLSRTHVRPIELMISWDDPLAVLPDVAAHLSHIRRLYFHAEAEHCLAILAVLRGPAAPSLEFLALSCGSGPVVTLPRDLFSGHAPALREVALNNIQLPSADPLPDCFHNIATLRFEGTARPMQLPNLLPHCPQLSHIHLLGDVTPGDPDLHRIENWRAVRTLRLFGRRTSEVWTSLGVSLRIPFIVLYACGTSSVISLAMILGTRLTVELFSNAHQAARDSVRFYAGFSAYGDARPHRRFVHMSLPASVHAFPQLHAITAFQDEVVSDRIAELVFELDHWGTLVGHYMTRFSALERLVLTVPFREVRWPPPPVAGMACPRLQTLALRRQTHAASTQPIVEAADIVAFAKSALSTAAFPLVLELHEIALRGTLDGAEEIFATRMLSSPNAAS